MAGFFRSHRGCYLSFFCCLLLSTELSLFMDILYKRYFGRLRLLRSSDVEENPGLRDSRRSCCVCHTKIRSLHKNLSNLSLMVEFVFFFALRFLSFPGRAYGAGF